MVERSTCRPASRTAERARYDGDLAQRRYLKVDPDNRLVADALEADWNQKLRALATAQEAYEKATAAATELVSALPTQPVPIIFTGARMKRTMSWITSPDSTCPPGLG